MTKRKHKFHWKIFCIVMASILLVYIVIAVWPRKKSVENNPFLIEEGKRPLLIAHGGGNKEFPDNTLEACYNAYSVDKNVMLEMDVSMTKDGVIIMSHDTTLDYRTSARGRIIDHTYTELLENRVDFSYLNKKEDGQVVEVVKYTNYKGEQVTPLDVQYPEGVEPRDPEIFLVTRLVDVLDCFPNNTVNVEIKQSGDIGIAALHKVVEILAEKKAFGRVVLASFHNEVYEEIKRIMKEEHPEILCSPEYVGVGTLLVSGALKLDAPYTEPVAVLQIPMNFSILNLDRAWFVRTAHSHNIAVHYWTIDNEDDMRHLIEIGADGIMTNLPHKLLDVYNDVFGNQQ